ncbi:Thiol-disulfide oxidoreductase ResA [Poriferisphaera corsica]|uniref:Thiol-disulfide oxidoreductase ResA n=1 Tax=Poriferisphaera corsica TaxID=2528020 RepID=A0A517YTC8_9BACT|nr:redoxin domain-containing protein [Poriferisphaera corsica]QDU33490.1 Thiol-disulfide oxidoreductase ResA [Poriferisphaera corsica]
MKKLTGSILGLMLVALIIVAGVSVTNAADEMKAKVGAQAPDFTLKDVTTGKEISLDDYKGKIVVMTFQSINCPWDRYREEGGYQRILSKLAPEYTDKGVQFIAINSNANETVEEVASYARESKVPYPILKDPGNVVADEYGGRTTPHFYVIDKDGKLVYMGGFENAPNTPENCGHMDTPYLVPVLNAEIEGKELPYKVTKSKGCGIKRAS